MESNPNPVAHRSDAADALADLVGSDQMVPCVDGLERPDLELDPAASTRPTPPSAEVVAFLPWYSSVHRGAGYKSRRATAAYEQARRPPSPSPAGTPTAGPGHPVPQHHRGHQSAGLPAAPPPSDVIVATVVEHHANLLPWARVSKRRFVECGPEGTFGVDDVVAALSSSPRPALLAITGASNVTGWMPPLDAIIAAAHERGVPVFVDAAQLAPHRPLPVGADFLALSGHKLYAPFGSGALIGPRSAVRDG